MHTLIGVVLLAAMLLAFVGVRYILRPSWHYCPHCASFWRVPGTHDNGVADTAECPQCIQRGGAR